MKDLIYNGVNCENYSIDENGNVYNKKTGKMRIPYRLKSNAYLYIKLFTGKGTSKTIYVHKAVYESYHNQDAGYTIPKSVRHIDGDITNNNIDNLIPLTRQVAVRKIRTFKYDDALIHSICKMLEVRNMSGVEIANTLEVPLHLVRTIVASKARVNIVSLYDIGSPSIYFKKLKQVSESEVIRVCEMLEEGTSSLYVISKEVGVNHNTVRQVYLKKIHRKISDKFDFSKMENKKKK